MKKTIYWAEEWDLSDDADDIFQISRFRLMKHESDLGSTKVYASTVEGLATGIGWGLITYEHFPYTPPSYLEEDQIFNSVEELLVSILREIDSTNDSRTRELKEQYDACRKILVSCV